MRATLAALALVVSLILPSAAAAQTITVDSTADVPGSGCILRDAIIAADTDSAQGGCPAGEGADSIRFSLPAGGTIALGSKLPEINTAVEILGPGAEEITISGSEAVAGFEIGSSAEVAISGLTITGMVCEVGCAFSNYGSLKLTDVLLTGNEAVDQGGTNAFSIGGAIFNNGLLEIVESDLTDNVAKASGATGQNGPEGGAISNFSAGDLTIVDSTLEGNQVVAVAGPGGTTNGHGGAISNFGKLTIRGSTLAGNSVSATVSAAGNAALGGAISNANSSFVDLAIERSTIIGNGVTASSPSSTYGGGGVSGFGGSVAVSSSTIARNSGPLGANIYLALAATIRSTIIAEPLGGGQSCAGSPLSQGFNLDEGTSCGFNLATDQYGVDPLLASGLADNGGPTPTIALEAGSPAIDQGHSAAGEATDQRGYTRPVDIPSIPDAVGGDGADVGAYEAQIPQATITAGPAEGSTTTETEPTLQFDADEAGATFICAVDGGAPVACSSPYKLPALSIGPHSFSVVATSPLGYAGPPAIRNFNVGAVQLPGGGGSGGGGGTSGGSGGGTGGGGGGGGQAVAPETTLSPLPARTQKRRLRIRFSSSQAGSTFSCKLDRKAWRACSSPFKTPKLAYGRHTFKVRASHAGITDPTPAKKTFRVLRPSR